MPIRLESTAGITSEISEIINTANTNIEKHNATVDNLAYEKSSLRAEIWKYLIEDARPTITTYLAKKSDLDKAVKGLSSAIIAKHSDPRQGPFRPKGIGKIHNQRTTNSECDKRGSTIIWLL